MLRFRLLIALVAGCLVAGSAAAGVVVDKRVAQEWEVSEWINGDPGRLATHRGRVVLIDFFQLWCPGCNSFSIPLFQRWQELYGERNDVLIVSIHSVFEGHDYQTVERLRDFVAEAGITHPVGVDSYERMGDEVPITMSRYLAGGTPQVVIIDKQGLIRFSHFGVFNVTPVEGFIDRLLKETPENQPTPPPKPRSRQRAAKPPPKRAQPEATDDRDRLSGRYLMKVEQERKSCGELSLPVDVPIEVRVEDDKLEIRSLRPIAGLRDLTADFDPRSGRFEAEQTKTVTLEGKPVTLVLRIEGTLSMDDDPPTAQFEFSMSKSGEEANLECEMEGRGDAALKAKLPPKRGG